MSYNPDNIHGECLQIIEALMTSHLDSNSLSYKLMIVFLDEIESLYLQARTAPATAAAASATDTSPGSTDTSPGSKDTSPGSTDTSPGSKDTSPGSTETLHARKRKRYSGGCHATE